MSLPAAASARTVPTRWVPWRRVGLRLSGWTRLLGARPAAAGEPGAALFRQLRLRLSLWYVAVLALALVVTGTAVYLVLQIKLLEAPNALIRNQAAFHAQAWGQGQIGACAANTPGPPPGAPARPPGPPPGIPTYAACFDTARHLVGAWREPRQDGAAPPAAFLTTALVEAAMRNGSASDVLPSGDETGSVLRYAVLVRDPSGSVKGVVMVGQVVESLEQTLALVRTILAAAGTLALLCATVGGWFLSTRALAPAKLAFERQQAFIADASHELRTPLTLLRANAELLLRERVRVPPDVSETLDDIVADTEHMARLAENMLTLARLDSGRLALEKEVVDLSGVAASIVRRITALAQQRSVAVGVESLFPALVLGDPDYLTQAALILIENAVKYTPAGGSVTVRTSASTGHVNLRVEDTGIGIPREHLARLGERFYRVDKSRARETGGAGLGLAIAFRIAAAHGGTIALDSIPGYGTRATLSLPAAQL